MMRKEKKVTKVLAAYEQNIRAEWAKVQDNDNKAVTHRKLFLDFGRQSLEGKLRIGTWLNEVKEKKLLDHGQWTPWLKKIFGNKHTVRTAQNWMNLSKTKYVSLLEDCKNTTEAMLVVGILKPQPEPPQPKPNEQKKIADAPSGFLHMKPRSEEDEKELDAIFGPNPKEPEEPKARPLTEQEQKEVEADERKEIERLASEGLDTAEKRTLDKISRAARWLLLDGPKQQFPPNQASDYELRRWKLEGENVMFPNKETMAAFKSVAKWAHSREFKMSLGYTYNKLTREEEIENKVFYALVSLMRAVIRHNPPEINLNEKPQEKVAA